MMMIPSADGELDSRGRREVGRRSSLKGLGMAGATLLPASALLMTKTPTDKFGLGYGARGNQPSRPKSEKSLGRREGHYQPVVGCR